MPDLSANGGVILAPHALIELLRLSSATLPTGGFAYSHGLESMIGRDCIRSESDACEYLTTLMPVTLAGVDLPRLVRMHRAWLANDIAAVSRESALLLASRESREAQEQDRQTARALARICARGVNDAVWANHSPRTYAEVYSYAAVRADIDECTCATGYAYVWAESHANALARLLPLGPMAMQRLLTCIVRQIPRHVERAIAHSEDDIGGAAPGLALAMAMHETQYSRIFRS